MIEEKNEEVAIKDEDNSNQLKYNPSSHSMNMYTAGKKRGPRKISRIYESPTIEEVQRILDITKKPHHTISFAMINGCGIRPAELIKLQPEDILFKENKIVIRQGKGKKDRVVNIPKQLRERHLKYFPLNITVRALEAVFLRNSLKAGVNRIIDYYTTKKGKKIPIYKYHLHSLRHAYATRALEMGLPLNYLQSLMGHANLATTSRYTKANPKDAIQAVMDKGI